MYCRIAKVYADFTIKHYELATVVFDGFGAGISIKDNTHKIRPQNIYDPIVQFIRDTEFQGK